MSNIEIKNLKLGYDEKVIFDNFNITFEENKINVILGESGIGKSTLLNAIAGIKSYGGAIEGAEDKISYIFQKDRLIPTISVYKNLDLILKSIYASKEERQKLIDDMLKMLEIVECKNKLPINLSGGQIQRVAIARAFLYPSKILLLDEPFKALDSSLKVRILKSFIDIYNANPRTVIFVTHAIDECLLLADNYYVFKGRPVCLTASGSIELDKCCRDLKSENLVETRDTLLKELF